MAIVAAVRQGGWVDNAIRVLTTFTFAMPPFWLGLMLALLLGFELKLFPVSGYETGISGILRTLTLPALTIGLGLLVIIVRNLRANLVTVLQSDYIEAVRARGYSELRVVGKHAMRNSVIGVITILASLFGFFVGLLVLVESVFQIPGAGTLLVQGVAKRDYNLVQTLVFLSGAVVVVIGFFTDVLYAWLDPRIRLGGRWMSATPATPIEVAPAAARPGARSSGGSSAGRPRSRSAPASSPSSLSPPSSRR